jgi:hypothetical protein
MSNSNKSAVTGITLCAAVVVLSLGYFDTDVDTKIGVSYFTNDSVKLAIFYF